MKKKHDEIKKSVRESYSKFLKKGSCSCCSDTCCGSTDNAESISKSIGYTGKDLEAVPATANLGFGCGNPVGIASLKEGETVLDLGSGAGLDAFLSAKRVGPNGRVIGIDMTQDMVERAKKNAIEGNYRNVEFRIGEIESLPVDDGSVDVIISNCVINLSPDKPGVFREAFRVLKPGGRIMVSDLVLKKKLPKEIKESAEAYAGCIAGACLKDEYINHIKGAGFTDIKILKDVDYPDMKEYVTSVTVSAVKKGSK